MTTGSGGVERATRWPVNAATTTRSVVAAGRISNAAARRVMEWFFPQESFVPS